MLKKLLIVARSNQSFAEAAGDLILRGFVGLTLAFTHGMGKLPPSEQFIAGVTGLGFPAPTLFAWLASGAEFFGGLFLALGLLTRPAAFFVAFTMAVAGFGAHAADPFGKKELAFLYLSISVAYFIMGAGRFSVDHLLLRRKRR